MLRAAAVLVFGFATAQSGRAAEINVLNNFGMRAILNEIGPQFEHKTGHQLVVGLGSAPELKKKIDAGERFDVAILTPTLVDQLIEAGTMVPSTRTDIASIGIGVVVRAGAHKPDIATVESFKQALLNAKSIGYTGGSVAGDYIGKLIERLGIANELRPKTEILGVGNSRNIKAVADGDVELGIGQIANIKSVAGVDFVGPLPREIQFTVTYSAGIATQAREPAFGKELVQFLTSPVAAQVIKAKGMEPVAPQ